MEIITYGKQDAAEVANGLGELATMRSEERNRYVQKLPLEVQAASCWQTIGNNWIELLSEMGHTLERVALITPEVYSIN